MAVQLGVGPAWIIEPAAAVAVVSVVFVLRPVAGVVAFLLFVLLAQTLERWLHADLRLFDEMGVMALALLSALRERRRMFAMRPGVQELFIGLVVGAGLISSAVAGVPVDTWLPALGLLIKGVVLFYAISWLRPDVSDVEAAGAVIVGVAGVVLVLGFVELLDPPRFQEVLGLPAFTDVRGRVTVVKSVFLHPAIFGWFTAFASLLLYARYVVFREWWALLGGIAFSVGALLSGRRRPVLGTLAGLAVAVLWAWRQHASARAMARTLLPLAGAVIVVAVLTAPALSNFYAQTIGEYLGAGDLNEILAPQPNPAAIAGSHPRLALYVGSVAIARDEFPLGAGLGRFGSYMSEAHYSPTYHRYGLDVVYGLGPDNPVAISDTFWPMILGELGVVGLVGMAGFLGLLTVRLWRTSRLESASLRVRGVALAGLLVFVEGLIGSLTAATYVAGPIAYYLFAAAGLVLATASIPSPSDGSAKAVP